MVNLFVFLRANNLYQYCKTLCIEIMYLFDRVFLKQRELFCNERQSFGVYGFVFGYAHFRGGRGCLLDGGNMVGSK